MLLSVYDSIVLVLCLLILEDGDIFVKSHDP